MVIPFAPGGTTDLLARAVGQHFQQTWGQTVVADNRAGANGVVGEARSSPRPRAMATRSRSWPWATPSIR